MPGETQNFSAINTDADFFSSYPLNTFLKRYDENTVVLLLPGTVNSTVAFSMVEQTKPFFFGASPFIKEISLSLNYFNPISEIYIEASFNYVRTIQGIISFEHTLKGGFPLMYSSHQFDLNLAKFYFGVKVVMFLWTICLFLYEFFTV